MSFRERGVTLGDLLIVFFIVIISFYVISNSRKGSDKNAFSPSISIENIF